MRVKFTNPHKNVQMVYSQGELVAKLGPNQSFETEDQKLIALLEKQSNLDGEEVDEKAKSAATAKAKAGEK